MALINRHGWLGTLLAGGTALLLAACVASTPEPQEKKALVFPEAPDDPRFIYERSFYSSADVEGGNEDSYGVQAFLTGEDGRSGTAFVKPYGVAARQGRVYVSDTAKRTVFLFDPARGAFKEIGKGDQGVLAKPMGMDLDQAGNLYVMDVTAKRVMVYDPDGNFLRGLGGKELFDKPSSVAVNPEGSKVYVVDTSSSTGKPENHRIRVLDAKEGRLLFDIGRRGDKEGEFNLLRDAAFGTDGLLYVVDGGNFRVQVFDQNGKFVRKFGQVGRQLGQFARPKGIGMGPDGNAYISDASHANFQIFNPTGDLLMFVGSRGKTNEPTSYLLPAMITLDEDGRIYMVDQGYRKVDVYRPIALKETDGALGQAFVKMRSGEGGASGDKPSKGEKKTAPDKAKGGDHHDHAPADEDDDKDE
ncbi:MAG: 6-bladed beta-propeller [Magnetococcales bacterium]|nr:6-bladed beta-propeller [Magnetococcales bacterium]